MKTYEEQKHSFSESYKQVFTNLIKREVSGKEVTEGKHVWWCYN